MTKEKYLVFAGNQYYPEGGMNDLKGIFYELDGAKKFAEAVVEDEHFRSLRWNWSQVYCVNTGKTYRYGEQLWVDG